MGTVSITQLTNGTTADATAVDNNFNAIANQINGNIDSTNLAANAITDSQLATSVSPVTFRKEAFANFVASGLTIATSASLTSTILAGTAYVNGKRVTLSNTPITVTASKDTYVDLKDDGSIVQVAVANGATSGMPLTTNSDSTNALRIAKLVSNGSAITTSTQTGWDPLGAAILNSNPTPITLGYAQITAANFTTASLSAVQVTGLTVTCTIPAGGRSVKITAFCGFLYNTTSSNTSVLSIWDGTVGSGTLLTTAKAYAPANNTGAPVTAIAKVTPSAGPKTYNVGLQVAAGGTAGVEVGTTEPAFILVEAI